MYDIIGAPKDGTKLLLLVDRKVIIGFYENNEWRAEISDYHGCGCCMTDLPQNKVTHFTYLPEAVFSEAVWTPIKDLTDEELFIEAKESEKPVTIKFVSER